jgi:hypothetical protein
MVADDKLEKKVMPGWQKLAAWILILCGIVLFIGLLFRPLCGLVGAQKGPSLGSGNHSFDFVRFSFSHDHCSGVPASANTVQGSC